MKTKLAELRKTPEAATPQTILAMCDLLEQMRDALNEAVDHLDWCGYGDKYEYECARDSGMIKRNEEALAAFDKFNGGE